MSKFTRWFSIDEDGQPTRPGWYDTLYSWEPEDYPEHSITTAYWNGTHWMWEKEDSLYRLSFGNEDTAGERWRGLASDPSKEPS